MTRMLTLMALLVLLGFSPDSVGAHGGGLDSSGGHNDRKNGGYHFHRGPLSGRSYSSKSAALVALRASRSGGSKKPKAASPATVIRKASSTKKINALIRLLVRKGIITERELVEELGRK